MPDQINLRLSEVRSAKSTIKDIFLCHNGADKPWVEMLAERIESQSFGDRQLAVVFDRWDFSKGGNIVLDIERFIDSVRFVGIVVSRAMLQAEWPTLERSIAVWSDPSGARGRVVPLVRENVSLPATLRVRNWIDFRDDSRFEDSFYELIRLLRGQQIPRGKASLHPVVPSISLPYESAPILITASTGADHVTEKLVTNLFRVTQIPERVYYAPTKLREKKEIQKYAEKVPPFILREGRLYSFTNLASSEDFRSVLTDWPASVLSDSFSDWFSDADYGRRGIELLNVCLKEHAWKRHLRFDKSKGRYFFTPRNGKPKRIAWRIAGVRRWREVTTPHMKKLKQQDGTSTETQFGWRQQGVRANFMIVLNNLMLKLEPTYLLTKEDGKTPRTSKWVGPILSHWLNQERNGQILRSLRFWSLVIAKGSELRIETGQSPICVDLTPISGSLDFGIASDQMNFDNLIDAEIEDDSEVPQLELFGEESSIAYAEENQFVEEEREE